MAAVAWTVLAGWASPASAVSCCPCDDFWIVSTRHIDEIPCDAFPSQVAVFHLEGGAWRRESLEVFLATLDPGTPTLFYVHGNRYTAAEAVQRGFLVNRYLRSGHADAAPLRFVIWSWPSDRIPGLINDVRAKAERTDTEGLYLGSVLSRMPPHSLVSLLGYSYGSRVVSGALHLVGGGQLEGRSLPPEYLMPRLPLRAGMLAPAFHNTWLLPGEFHSRTLTQVERLLVIYNRLDPVLRRYRLVAPGSRAQALGFTGLAGLERLGPQALRVEQFDMTSEVGRSHDELDYLNTSAFAAMREYLLWRTWR
jgi:hypothetical protein